MVVKAFLVSNDDDDRRGSSFRTNSRIGNQVTLDPLAIRFSSTLQISSDNYSALHFPAQASLTCSKSEGGAAALLS
ncbi:hypothetical protein MLD38_007903 [Melastoma candidum]|uniref:Uncharacterized protein n=1 Tax=Melastoma candidum TaxID=119954 RepID=A0ACB9RTY5_9MYRT|nr:hypothetical protein MLD38_007903 [Melastoma candidum]